MVFQKYFSYIVAVSFIGGGRKPEKTTDLSKVVSSVVRNDFCVETISGLSLLHVLALYGVQRDIHIG